MQVPFKYSIREKEEGNKNMGESQHMHPPYVYSALSSPHSIRLLRLHDAASFDDQVECSIETHELDADARPPYTALSYTWGGSSRDETIVVTSAGLHDGAVVPVTPTLTEALRYMREFQRDRDRDRDDTSSGSSSGNDSGNDSSAWWWVDMVCIDQTNVAERSQQVALMRDIFQAAATTTAWLGPAADGSDELMAHLVGEGGGRQALRAWAGSAAGRAAVASFQGRAYWGRAWVIQEVCVSRAVVLACGRRTAAWRALDAAHKWLWTYPHAHSTPDLRVLRQRFQGRDRQPDRSRTYDGASPGLTLGFLVYRASAARCSDARDKVFALLGLVTSGHGAALVPDYSMSPCAVFAAAIRATEKDVTRPPAPASGSSRGRWRRADSFRKKLVLITEEIRENPHNPLNDDDGVRLGCDGSGCGTWELCWRYCGIALHLE